MGKSHWSLHNDILGAWAMTVGLFALLAIVFGPVVLPYLLLQAVLGFSLLEVVNYLEHYGLLRQKKEDGRYERCLPEHSWNSNNVASNVLLYHLQRHSDHHANPTRRYQALRHFKEAPQLPTGYAGMIVLAWFPPLWRRVMDPRLVEHYDGEVSRANIQPRARQGSSPATAEPRHERLSLPQLRLHLRRGGRPPARGLPAGDAVERGPGRLGLPRLRRARQGRLRAGRRRRRVTAPAATIGGVMEARTPYPEAARNLLRETLFGPMRDELERRTWSEITMSDIAGAAGVSRQTLYKEFGSRDEFAQAFVIHDGERFLDDVDAAVREHLDDPRAAIGAALETFLRTAGEDPLVRILLSDDGTRRHAALRHHPGDAGRPVGDRPPLRDDRRGLAAGAAAESTSARGVAGAPGDQLRHRPGRVAGDDGRPHRRAARPLHRRGARGLSRTPAVPVRLLLLRRAKSAPEALEEVQGRLPWYTTNA